MNELSWEQIELSNEFYSSGNLFEVKNGVIKKAFLAVKEKCINFI